MKDDALFELQQTSPEGAASPPFREKQKPAESPSGPCALYDI